MKRLLILLLFLAPTLQYRVELGPVSFALMEPVVLLIAALLLAYPVVSGQRLVILKEPLVYFFGFITLWAGLIRPWATDWQHGLSDVRDWVIPLIGFAALVTTVRRSWQRWIILFLVLVWLNALVGIYQHLTNSFRPFVIGLAAYKTGFTVSEDDYRLALVSFAAGFFTHPNAFAMYLFAGLMMCLGRLAESRKWVLYLFFLVPLALALFWTYAKASLLVMGMAVGLFWLERRIKSNRSLWVGVAASLSASMGALWLAAQYLPPVLLDTFWWRAGLWQTGLTIIGEYPAILFLGSGMDQFAKEAYYGQPHNLYIYLLLEYGLPGLVWAILLLWHLWTRGWRIRRAGLMQSWPMLAAMWITLLGYFVIGLVESNLLGIESRMLFFLLAACFVGLSRETAAQVPTATPTQSGREPHAGPTLAYSHPI